MNRLMSATLLAAAATAALSGAAQADVSKPVIAAFKGQIVVTKGDLPAGKSDKDTVGKIKSERLKAVTGEKGEEVTHWEFHYTAFLTKVGATNLKMEFFRDGSQLAADKQLDGIDPKSAVLSGDISIDEDEGLAKGKSYVVKLVTDKHVTVATTPLTMN